jgi:hypothetical protein
MISWSRFEGFLSPAVDRHAELLSLLSEAGVSGGKAPSVTLQGARHIIVPAASVDKKRAVILIAHYDRTRGSPGANDNGAAVFILARTAMKLLAAGVRDWLVIFTDKEELAKGAALREQGSFTLARALRQSGFRNNPCFIFDTVGRGDTFIISTAAKHLLREEAAWTTASPSMRRAIETLNYRALEAARRVNLTRIMLLPTPFSDDAGFFLAGFPAQTITMLPAEEAAAFGALLRAKPSLLTSLITGTLPVDTTCPATWRLINSPSDTAETLTRGNFALVEAYAEALAWPRPSRG